MRIQNSIQVGHWPHTLAATKRIETSKTPEQVWYFQSWKRWWSPLGT